MAKDKQLLIEVRDKIATLKSKNFNLVGGNNDYDVVFDFDEDWQDLTAKTAVFVFGKAKPVYVPFEGNVCEGVAINDATMCLIGVFSGDLRTTTPAAVDCVYRSILDEANGTPEPPAEDVYNQIMDLLNRYVEAAKEIPKGGKRGQVLKKNSDDDYDYSWKDDVIGEIPDGKFAPLVDGKVPMKNIPNNAFDIIRGEFALRGGIFFPIGEHNEELDEFGCVVPRQGVLYFGMNEPYEDDPFAGSVCIWRGKGFERIATVGEFEAALQSMKQSIDRKIEDVEQDVDALDGKIGDISSALDELHAYAQNLVNGGSAE